MKKFFTLVFLLFGAVTFSLYGQATNQNQAELVWDSNVGCLVYEEIKGRDIIPNQNVDNENCSKVCENSQVDYSIIDISGTVDSVNWIVTGGTANQTSGSNITVTWDDYNVAANLTVEVTFVSNGNTQTATIDQCVEILQKPTADFETAQGSLEVCAETEISFLNTSFANGDSQLVNYLWNFDSGNPNSQAFSNEFEPTYTYLQPGVYDVTLTVWNECNCVGNVRKRIRVGEPSLSIECPTVVCEGTTEQYFLSTNELECSEKAEWTALGGTIVGPNNNFDVEVTWDNIDDSGFGTLIFDASECALNCRQPVAVRIPVITDGIKPKGETALCPGNQYRYKMPQWPTTDFQWEVRDSNGVPYPDATVLVDQRNEIVVDANELNPSISQYTLEVEYFNTLLKCGGSSEIDLKLTDQHTVTGDTTACVGDTVNFSTENSGNIEWFVNGDLYSNSSSFNFTPNQAQKYSLSVRSDDYCTSEVFYLDVYEVPAVPDESLIEGPDEICLGVPYTFTIDNSVAETVIQWEIEDPANNNIIGTNMGNTITAEFFEAPFRLRVKRINLNHPDCSSEFSAWQEFNGVQVSGSIKTVPEGQTTFCTSDYAYFEFDPDPIMDTDGIEEYEWSFEHDNFASITSGQGTPSIEVNINEVSNGNNTSELRLRVRKCGDWYEFDLNGNRFIDPFEIDVEATPQMTLLNPPSILCPNDDIILNVNLSEPLDVIATQDIKVYLDGNEDHTINYTPTNGWTNSLTITGITIEPNINNQSASQTINIRIIKPNGCNGNSSINHSVTVLPEPEVGISYTPGYMNVFCEDADINTSFDVNNLGQNNIVNYHLWKENALLINDTFVQTFSGSINNINITPTMGFGNYYIIAEDANGCLGESNRLLVKKINCEDPPPPMNFCNSALTLTESWSGCNEITVNAIHSSNLTLVNMSWTQAGGPENLSVISSNNNQVKYSVETPGVYYVNGFAEYYNPTTDETCYASYQIIVTIDYQADLQYEITCAGNGQYNVTLYNNSEYHTAPDNVTFLVDNNPIPGSNTQAQTTVGPGQHDFEIVLSSNGKPTCTDTKNVTIDALQAPGIVATNTCSGQPIANNANICAECPIAFAPVNGIDPDLEYEWSYKNTGYLAAETEVTFESDSQDYIIELTVIDTYGCTATSEFTINSNESDLAGAITGGNHTQCPGSVFTLGYSPGLNNPGIPNAYQWMEGQTALSGETNPTFSTQTPGLYWLKVYDGDGCRADIEESVYVAYSPNPYVELNAPATACAQVSFELQASVTPNSSYEWIRETSGGSPSVLESGTFGASQYVADLLVTENQAGIYSYSLAITDAEGCSATSVADVEVMDENISINPPVYSNCAPYEVQLSVNGPSTGTYLWSNGMSGQNITVYHGGPYRVTYLSEAGCAMTDEVSVERHPEEYVWIFPTGCMEFCVGRRNGKALDRTIIGPIPPFDQWSYHEGGPVYTANGVSYTGTDSTVDTMLFYDQDYPQDPLNIYLSNGNCQINSDKLDLRFAECERCEMEVELGDSGYNSASQYFELYADFHFGGIPPCATTISFNAPNNDGYFIPGSITLLPGQTVAQFMSNPLLFVPNSNFSGGTIVVQVSLSSDCEEPIDCLSLYEFEVEPINFDRPGISIQEPVLELVPNPARGETQVNYEIDESLFSGKAELQVYNLQGQPLINQNLNNANGNLRLNLSRLQPGSYLVVLQSNGQQLAHQMLVVR